MEALQLKKTDSKADRVLLVILDGVGVTPKDGSFGNAVDSAYLPNLKSIWNQQPTLQIRAHGTAVGMPSDEDMGNSEVGHNVLGCGRVFDQGAKLVSNSINSGEMFRGHVWKEALSYSQKNKSTLHFLGLFSDGNVHSHIDHLRAMIQRAIQEKISKIRIHILLDGRDVPEKSALDYIDPFEKYLSELRNSGTDIKIASGGGRMEITMDRYEADWSMVERGWKTHVLGEGPGFPSARDAILHFREKDSNLIDQYFPAFVIHENGVPVGKIQDGDSVIFFNFRGDRAIEISRAFTEKNFTKFSRKLPKIFYAGMMQYDGDLKLPEKFLVSPPAIDRTLGEYMAKTGLKQYAISETQKFGHVTYFWNGNRSGYFNEQLETYKEIPSDILPFDQAPKMKAQEITDELIQQIESQKYDFLRVNYANGDMVGHTGNFKATVEGLEFLDICIGRLKEACEKSNCALLITADHGNADEMYQLDKKGNVIKSPEGKPLPKTSHTLNPVNFSLVYSSQNWKLNPNVPAPGLGNIAATILDILGYEAPEGYLPSLLLR
jgi:2,3-bisphosphoglycerate-independent phosphoglycerate mutase